MTRLNYTGDLIYGVVLLGAIPVLVYVGAEFVASHLFAADFERDQIGARLVRWTILAISFLSFLLACRWRRSHRRGPVSTFPLEVTLSVKCGFAYMVALILALYAAGGAD